MEYRAINWNNKQLKNNKSLNEIEESLRQYCKTRAYNEIDTSNERDWF